MYFVNKKIIICYIVVSLFFAMFNSSVAIHDSKDIDLNSSISEDKILNKYESDEKSFIMENERRKSDDYLIDPDFSPDYFKNVKDLDANIEGINYPKSLDINQRTRGITGIPLWIYGGEARVRNIEVGDLNGDGVSDVICGEYNESTTTVYPSKVFALSGLSGGLLWDYQLNGGVRTMVVADLNNDSIVDVIVGGTSGDGKVSAINGSDGSLLWFFSTGNTNDEVAVGNINGDDYPDIVLACFDDYVYAIDGLTGLEIWHYDTGGIWAGSVATGDVDFDGIDDVAFSSYYGGNNFGLLNGVNGLPNWNLSHSTEMISTHIADIDEDGDLEIITGDDAGDVFVYDDHGVLEWSSTVGGEIYVLDSHDVDNDTELELVVGTQVGTNKVSLFEGDISTPIWSYTSSGYVYDISYGDIDGDGFGDIAVAASTDLIVLNNTDGSLVWSYTSRIYAVGCADFDIDGVFDVAAGGTDDTSWPPNPTKTVWALKTGFSQKLWEYDIDQYGSAVALDDFNNDGCEDAVAVTSAIDTVYVVDGKNGSLMWSWVGTDGLHSVATGDFDNDGFPDVAVGGYDNIVTALNGVNGSFMWNYVTGDDIYRKYMQSTDLNSDGYYDVIAASEDNFVYAFHGLNGSLMWSYNCGADPGELILGQMDGVGGLEIIVAIDGLVGKNVAVLSNTGSELWTWDSGSSGYNTQVKVGDFNDDGNNDVVFGNPNNNELTAINGITQASIWSITANDIAYDYALATGFVDGDTVEDVIVGASSDNKVYVYNGTNGDLLWDYTTGGSLNVVWVDEVTGSKSGNEVLAGSDDDSLYVLSNSGSLIQSYVLHGDAMHLQTGDINGDGTNDIAAVSWGSTGYVYAFSPSFAVVGGTATGYVKNSGGDPIANAQIYFAEANAYSASNSAGLYSKLLDPGVYNVTVTKQGYYSSTDQITITAGNTSYLNFTLNEITGTLNVFVKDTEDNPLQSSHIIVRKNGLIVSTGFTNSTGEYETTLQIGSYQVEASKNGYWDVDPQFVTIIENTTSNIVFILDKIPLNVGSIEGFIKDENEDPIFGVLVSVTYDNITREDTTDLDGHYLLTLVLEGSQYVNISAQNYVSESILFTVTANQTSWLNVTLSNVVSYLWTHYGVGDVYLTEAIDLNDDNIEELVVAGSGGVVVLNNDSFSDNSYIWGYDLDFDSADFYGCKGLDFADINDDNIIDIIIGSTFDYHVYALSGDTGRLLWKYYTGAANTDLHVVDLEGDGYLEVVISCYNFYYPLQIANASNGIEIEIFSAGGYVANTLSVADLTGDTVLDVVIGLQDYFGSPPAAGAVASLDMSTQTQIWWHSLAEGGSGISDIIIDDFDSGGFIDVAYCSLDAATTHVAVLNGDDGNTHWEYDYTSGFISLEGFDLTNDGTTDLLAGAENGMVFLLDGLGSPPDGVVTWQNLIGFQVNDISMLNYSMMDTVIVATEEAVYLLNGSNGSQIWASPSMEALAVTVSDLNDDSVKEIAVGTGTFDHIVNVLNVNDGGIIYDYITGDAVVAVASADINSDSREDVFAGDWDNNVYAFNGPDGDILWIFDHATDWIKYVETEDIDGDGIKEVIASSWDNTIYAIDEDGSEIWSYYMDGILYPQIAFADFNNDGIKDVAAGIRKVDTGTGGDVVALNGSDGSIIWINTEINVEDVDVLNINGGITDVIIGTNSGFVIAYDGSNGSTIWSVNAGSPAIKILKANLDNDGFDDVVVGLENGIVKAYNSSSDLKWQYDLQADEAEEIVIADVTGDGIDDVAARHYAGLEIFMINGSNGVKLWQRNFANSIWSLEIGEVNNDGTPDVLAGVIGDTWKQGYIYAVEGRSGNVLWHSIDVGRARDIKQADIVESGYEEIIAPSENRHLYVLEIFNDIIVTVEISNIIVNPEIQEINGWVNISCNVNSDNALSYVILNLTDPDSIQQNKTMLNILTTDIYYDNDTYIKPGDYNFVIIAEDVNGTKVTSRSFDFKIGIPPEITSVQANPTIQDNGGWVNLTCTVTDNDLVNSVIVNITDPDLNETNNIMSSISGTDNYYYNTTYSINGTYDFYIIAEDNNGNINTSNIFNFNIGIFSIDIELYENGNGWNLITIPLYSGMTMASHLADNITQCITVNKWDAVNQTYKPYIVGGPPDFDFPISPGMGLFVEVSANSTLTVSGSLASGISIDMHIPWNMIGWYHTYDTMASSLAENITGCLTVNKWDAVNQTYKPYIVGGPPDFDFQITAGMGLFVEVDTISTWNGEG
jgi:outer membrane protein assembly factor BamB